jgi:hypothetical protein
MNKKTTGNGGLYIYKIDYVIGGEKERDSASTGTMADPV